MIGGLLEAVADMMNAMSPVGSGPGSSSKSLPDEELRTATAALLIHAISIDETVTATEQETITKLLQDHFDISESECKSLMETADAKEKDAVDLYSFTRVLTKNLDQDGRQAIVKLLWKTVYADDELHSYEDNLVWRVAELLGVSTADRIRIKKRVQNDLATGDTR